MVCAVLFLVAMVCHDQPPRLSFRTTTAFTLVETVVAIGLIGVGIATVMGALTHINSIAFISRNETGAYTVLMNQVGQFESLSPFNPQKSEIPVDTSNGTYPLYDMTPTPSRQLSVDGTSWNIPVYEYRDNGNNTITIVNAQLTETVTDLSTSTPALPNTYQAVFTLTYTYRNRTYTYSMSGIRTSDS
jgi:Tfp pilus assembly protein PilV